MDNKSVGQFLVMKDIIDAIRQYYDEKMKNIAAYLTSMIASMMDQIKFSKSSPDKKYSSKSQDPITAVLVNKKAPPLEGGIYTKIGVMCNLKPDISSPKLYELLINT